MLIPHFAAFVPALALSLPLWLRALLLVGVSLSLFRQTILHLSPATRIVSLTHLADERWALTDGRGRRQLGRLSHWYVAPRLCVLRFRCQPGARSVVLPRSALPADQHRRLRASLRLLRPDSGA